MEIKDKVIVVTGGAAGIGRAMCERFARDGARTVVVVDLKLDAAQAAAQSFGGAGMAADVSAQADIERVVAETEQRFGPIDLFCSNAGVLYMDPDFDDATSGSVEHWQRSWNVHVMAHMYAAKALIPRYRARGGGYFLNTVSAAGLLSQIGSGCYSASKHAALGFAENLAITHRADNIKVSVLCPQAVQTGMLPTGTNSAKEDGVLTPDQVADAVVQGLAAEKFLILPHAQVLGYLQRKTTDYDRWIAGMARLRETVRPPQ